tara:strand:- start:136 stop:348 length:213 start_codon:yes stop_codon:yes gene_type:complete
MKTTKKQQLQVTANNKAVMMWVISTVQNNERQIYGVYTDIGDAFEVEKLLEKQGFEVSFLETCLNFAFEE